VKTISQVSTQFAPIKAILDSALLHGGGRYDAPSHGSAVNFRQRAYAFRKAYREACAPGASPYDALTIRKLGAEDTHVIIEPLSLPGTFVPADGPALAVPADDDDPFLEEALRLKQDLGL
jgi:hypothetical protein